MLRLTTLGALDLRDHLGHPVQEVLAQPKRLALFVYLALEARRGPITRDRLLAMFWPESDGARARNTLSQSLHHLRQALGGDVLESHGVTAIGLCHERLWCDATVFGEALEQGEAGMALDLYRGEFCPMLFVSGAPEFEQWLDAQRRRLRGQAQAASRTMAERLLARDDLDGAARAARRALALRPDDEADLRAMLALLERCGDAAGALAAYQEFAERLAKELELEPAAETRQLVEALRRRREQEAAATRAAPSESPWAQAPPVARIAATAPAARPRRLVAAAILAGAVLIAGGIGLLARHRTPAIGTSATAIAVFPFTVRSGAGLTYLREGMVDLISAKLEGASGFHAIDPRSVMAAVASRPDSGAGAAYAALARRLGAGRYISGQVVQNAGRLQIDAALFDPAQGLRPVAVATVSGDTTRLFELVDLLTGRMLARLVTGRDTSLTRLAALTTTSLPALKAFLEGEQAMRAGRDAQAAAAFREAVDLDSTFALAEYRLALSATWITVPGIESNAQVTEMSELAERHARRLAPLIRDLLAAFAAYKELRAAEIEARYRRITDEHPDNVEAWFMLGETYFHYNPYIGRSRSECRAPFERVLALDPTNAHALLHLARLAALDGQTSRLDSLGAQYLTRYRDAARTLEMRALLAGVHDDPAERRTLARDALGSDDVVFMSVAQAAMDYAQNPGAARELLPTFRRSVSQPIARQFGLVKYSTLPLAEGHWSDQAALQLMGPEANLAWLRESRALLATIPELALPRQRLLALRDSFAALRSYPVTSRPNGTTSLLTGPEVQAWIVGLLSARAADFAVARRSVATLDAAPLGVRAEVGRALARSLRAEIARSAGDNAAALAEMHGFRFLPAFSDPLSWGMYERFLMAELEESQSHDEAALGWYESFPLGYDLPWQALSHLRQARIYERRRNAERARFHYQRVVSLWAGADPEFQPLLAQARAGVERLRRGTGPT